MEQQPAAPALNQVKAPVAAEVDGAHLATEAQLIVAEAGQPSGAPEEWPAAIGRLVLQRSVDEGAAFVAQAAHEQVHPAAAVPVDRIDDGLQADVEIANRGGRAEAERLARA